MGIDENNQPAQLPKMPSALQRLAVQDVQKCAADPRYELRMCHWHLPRAGHCLVCMAGAVMAQTLNADPREWLMADDLADAFGEGVAYALEAIDCMRTGDFELAARQLIDGEFTIEQRGVMESCGEAVRARMIEDKGHAPWHVYLECADRLELVGL